MPDVFDLDALAKDVTAEPFRFRFGGEDYEIPCLIDMRWVAAIETDRVDDALRLLLGPEQYRRMQQSPAVFDRLQFDALVGAFFTHVGSSLGESPASTDS